MRCRHCGSALKLPLVDLATAPPSNAYLTRAALHGPETWYPLRVLVCERCWLVQTEDFTSAEALFTPDYAYFSGFSQAWVRHCERYVEEMVSRFGLNPSSRVMEIASNDGTLLRFVKDRGIACLGIEPTASTAASARDKGIETLERFFGVDTAEEIARGHGKADLVAANNVLAHVPDINDFLGGFSRVLAPNGVLTFEFPHLLELVRLKQFDTIYHEHFSYLSLTATVTMLEAAKLRVFDVEKLPTHGGSLRVFVTHAKGTSHETTPRVDGILREEAEAGMRGAAFYSGFQAHVDRIKDDLLVFLIQAKREGKRVWGYGAAAKGNTLLNYAGLRGDLVHSVVDRNPQKQGKFLPGSRIPVVPEDALKTSRPDYVLLLPWNLREELVGQLDYVSGWGGRLVVAIPRLEVL